MNKMINLVHELDSELNSIGSRIDVLSDAQNKLTQLVTNMNNAVHRGEEKFYFHEHHREIRVLSELIQYAMKDLATHYDKADLHRDTLCKAFLKEAEVS